ncbi:MAG: hypothetical protein EBU93_05505, partial [Chlamydiae bacterium]|nr:hypothetical protein [Chlamydiota bacterium]
MKLALASDVHLEFGDINLENTENADILILAGDICVAKDCIDPNYMGERNRNFFQRVTTQFPKVIYVMGNHEHYDGDFIKSKNILQKMFDDLFLSNVFLLEKESITIDNFTFIGGTLWTDMNKKDPLTMWNAGKSMNDYKIGDFGEATFIAKKGWKAETVCYAELAQKITAHCQQKSYQLIEY